MNTVPDMLSAGLQTVAALGLVLGVIFSLLYVLRRINRQPSGRSGGKAIQLLENHYLGVKKSICLVRVPGKVLVLGVCSDRINLLDSLDEKLIGESIPSPEPKSFGTLIADRLASFGPGRSRKDAP